jgi:Domain of unknown function (DUF4192)
MGRPGGVAGKVQLRAGTPDAVLAIVPHLLGFYPSHSLVVLGLSDRNLVTVTFRYDLPDPPEDDLASDIAEHATYVLTRERIRSAMLIGYGPLDLVVPVALEVGDRLVGVDIELREVLRAEAGRFWSLLCSDESCCPPEGAPYDPGSHPAAATMTAAGLTAHPDRAALVRTLQAPAGVAAEVRQATGRAQQRMAEVVAQSAADGDRDPRLRVARIGRTAVQRAIRCYRGGGAISRREELAWLAVLLTDLRVRDDAWARMDPAHHAAHCRLWTDVVKGAAVEFVPAPASLLAFTAWQAGNGALAAVAVDRALAADSDYSMAMLMAGVIEAGLPPSAARLPMTPAQVAASYASSAAPGRSSDRTASRRVEKRQGSRRSSRRQSHRGGARGDQRGKPRHRAPRLAQD